MTRALGHIGLQHYGVIPVPYIKTFHLGPEHCCLVLASDGVWDAMEGQAVVDHVMASYAAGRTATEAARQLVAFAVDVCLSEGNNEADNTTAIVVFF